MKTITTQDEARQYAINLQNETSEESPSYAECAETQADLRELAERFDLVEEFEENGII